MTKEEVQSEIIETLKESKSRINPSVIAQKLK